MSTVTYIYIYCLQNGSNGVKDDLELQENICIDRLCVRLSKCLQRCSMSLFSALQIRIRQRPDADCVKVRSVPLLAQHHKNVPRENP